MTDPGTLLDRGRDLQRRILRAGGPPPEDAARWRQFCRALDEGEQQLRGGLGLVWFAAWPLGLALAGLVTWAGYLLVKVTPEVEQTTIKTMRMLGWVLVGGTALLFAGAAKRLASAAAPRRRRRKAVA